MPQTIHSLCSNFVSTISVVSGYHATAYSKARIARSGWLKRRQPGDSVSSQTTRNEIVPDLTSTKMDGMECSRQGRPGGGASQLPNEAPGSCPPMVTTNPWVKKEAGRVPRAGMLSVHVCGFHGSQCGPRYQVFVKAMTSRLKEKDPKLNQTERMKQIGEMWRTMPLSEREAVRHHGGRCP
eukprot:766697-Hanusia_phi.AAC.4